MVALCEAAALEVILWLLQEPAEMCAALPVITSIELHLANNHENDIKLFFFWGGGGVLKTIFLPCDYRND